MERVTVDTTVRPKNVSHPTDTKLIDKAIVMLGALAREHGLKLRQSYVRVAKRAAIMAGRYAHAKQWKRQRRQLKFLRTRLGWLIREIRRKTEGDADLTAAFAGPLSRASQVRSQQQRQRGWKLYSLHAPEVECIAKGKAHKPYEFGCKVSITTTNARSPGGQFVLHAKAFHGRPYDGHTLGTVIAETQALTGVEIKRVYVDKGYIGHDAPMLVQAAGNDPAFDNLINGIAATRRSGQSRLRALDLSLQWTRQPALGDLQITLVASPRNHRQLTPRLI